MANEREKAKRHKWIFGAGDVLKTIDKTSLQVWANRATSFILSCEEKGKHPFLATFWKEHGLWIYNLRDELSKGNYNLDKWKSSLDKYYNVDRIIKAARMQDAINRNIDKASFAQEMLKQEKIWDRDEGPQSGNITLNLVDFASLMPPQASLPTNQIDNTIIDNDGTQSILDASFENIAEDEIDISDEDLQETLNKFLGDK